MLITDNTQKVCGTCKKAREAENLPPTQRVCREGYGFKGIMQKACDVWEPPGRDEEGS